MYSRFSPFLVSSKSLAPLGVAGLFEFNFGDAEVTMNMLDVLAVAFAAAAQPLARIENEELRIAN